MVSVERIQKEPTLHSLDKRMTAHEQVCAERQGTIIKRLGRIEGIFLAVFGVLAMSQWQTEPAEWLIKR